VNNESLLLPVVAGCCWMLLLLRQSIKHTYFEVGGTSEKHQKTHAFMHRGKVIKGVSK